MKIKKSGIAILEGDMTPMIDMTFQLVAFLMVLVNFSADDVSQALTLPESELAKPPDGVPPENRIIIQITKEGRVIMGAEEMQISAVKTMLKNEKYVLQQKNQAPSDSIVIIRADLRSATGKVQEIIKICQEEQFDRFVLRAKEKT